MKIELETKPQNEDEKALLEEQLDKIEKEYKIKQDEIQEKQDKVNAIQRQEEAEITKNFLGKVDEETIQDILSTKYENIVEFIDEKEREQTDFKITEKLFTRSQSTDC